MSNAFDSSSNTTSFAGQQRKRSHDEAYDQSHLHTQTVPGTHPFSSFSNNTRSDRSNSTQHTPSRFGQPVNQEEFAPGSKRTSVPSVLQSHYAQNTVREMMRASRELNKPENRHLLSANDELSETNRTEEEEYHKEIDELLARPFNLPPKTRIKPIDSYFSTAKTGTSKHGGGSQQMGVNRDLDGDVDMAM